MTATIETAILEREEEWREALMARDADRLATILAPAFALEILTPAPVIMRRDEWLRLLPQYIVHAWEVLDQSVALDGDAASVFMRMNMQATVGGVDRSGDFVLTDIWRRSDDGWRVWRRHSTPLQAGAIPRA